MIQIQWNDTDPETGEKRIVCAERFAKEWRFKWKSHRRQEWNKGLQPTREIWEYILDNLQRRYQRRQGVDIKDVEQVERILKEWREPFTGE